MRDAEKFGKFRLKFFHLALRFKPVIAKRRAALQHADDGIHFLLIKIMRSREFERQRLSTHRPFAGNGRFFFFGFWHSFPFPNWLTRDKSSWSPMTESSP